MDSSFLRENIQDIMCKMSQNISTTECLLSNLRSKEDLVEVRGKMIEAAGAIEVLVPQLQMYMNQDEPRDEDAKKQWWLERERINRDLDNALKNFQIIRLVLDNCNNFAAAKSLSKTLMDINSPLKQRLSELKNYEFIKPQGLDYYKTRARPTPVDNTIHLTKMETEEVRLNEHEEMPKPITTVDCNQIIVSPGAGADIDNNVAEKAPKKAAVKKHRSSHSLKETQKRRPLIPCTIS